MNKNLSLLRQLANEIRKTSSEKNIGNNVMMRYIVEQSSAHKETSETLCKAREELYNLAHNYLCYLQSIRKYQEIHKFYSGKGERSTKETAKLVGFKLPHDPR
ncbi:protein FMC1 homolog [Copidosoma floridanum]|uniref:protein FMC1 homolog n=1 Tax=Copidosoma floridanum TaxID=29053 RepID=UPI0006C977CA|nr:protein FMC1 homolog [Copidosoma floridanum]